MCACGKPLHYSNPETQRQVQSLVDELGATIRVRGSNGRVWLVPRHYLALHGLKARELPELGFPEVTGETD